MFWKASRQQFMRDLWPLTDGSRRCQTVVGRNDKKARFSRLQRVHRTMEVVLRGRWAEYLTCYQRDGVVTKPPSAP